MAKYLPDQKLDKNYELNPIYSKNEIIFYKPLQSMCYYTKYTILIWLILNLNQMN